MSTQTAPKATQHGQATDDGSWWTHGNYTRPYIAYYDRQGKVHKAFVLPQKDPNFYTFYLRCFNRPEFMVEPVKVTPQEFAKKAKEDAIPAKYAK